ncbi:phosphopantetheine-binding protein [Embleya sp. NPDC020886]|uniref:phosphopantetheine-binding protein n=1 Tax=Embleya sp. NPDC020886 TaxID=3363980 RepID=UPI00379F048D
MDGTTSTAGNAGTDHDAGAGGTAGTAGPAPAPAPPTSADLRASVSAMIGTPPGEIAGDANLVLLGLGSLEMMRLVNRWRRQGLAIEFRDLAAEPTIDAWTERLASAGAKGSPGAKR